MDSPSAIAFERDCALVEAMRFVGEPDEVIEGFLLCLDISDGERSALRMVAGLDPMTEASDIANGDVIAMNPLTSQPQRRVPRTG
jgi:hypothetical protein